MIPHATEALRRWKEERSRTGRMLLALDYDGTLAPIVPRPAEAAMLPAARRALERLAARTDTIVAIVSGRGLADVRERVGLASVFYAGNHGLEIRGPGIARDETAATAARSELGRCADALRNVLHGRNGVEIEDKGITLSVHYRRVLGESEQSVVRAAVAEACGDIAGLRLTHGRKVVEIRPAVEWDKGRATAFLVEKLAPDHAVPVLYIGDDTTDEDAFRALAGRGDGVFVGDPPPGTAATFFVRDPADVAALLSALADALAPDGDAA